MKRIFLSLSLFTLSLTAFAGEGGDPIADFVFSEALCPMYDAASSKWGYIDMKGAWAIKPQWSLAYPFSEGMALTLDWSVPDSPTKNIFIDKKGKSVLDLASYNFVAGKGFSGGLALVKAKGEGFENKWYIIDKQGKETASFEASFVDQSYHEGLARFSTKDMKWGYVDVSGKVAIQATNGFAWEFSEGRAFIQPKIGERKLHCIDKKGTVLFELTDATWVTQGFSGGLALIQFKGGSGPLESRVIDLKGATISTITAAQGDAVRITSGMLALGGWEEKKRIVRLVSPITLKPAVNGVWKDVGIGRNGFIAVSVDGKIGFIDSKGAILIKPQFSLMPMGPM